MVAVVEVCRSGADKKVMDRTSMANESAAVHTERTALGVGPLEVGLYPRDGAIPVLADHASLLSRRGGLVVCRGRSGSGGGGGDRGAQPEEACAVAGRPSNEGAFGLFSIRERMADLAGALEIESEPGKGCKATLVAPLEKGEK